MAALRTCCRDVAHGPQRTFMLCAASGGYQRRCTERQQSPAKQTLMVTAAKVRNPPLMLNAATQLSSARQGLSITAPAMYPPTRFRE